MKNFSMSSAKSVVRHMVARIEPPAIDYVNWAEFEEDLEKVMATDFASEATVKPIFVRACNQARQAYRAAVAIGAHQTLKGTLH